mmetsp:Transcript_13347/g.21938  ORF Transcript_13347/g.21938 Transcript_13347/m.21938 type:complete len:93 (-) Transcript_13347:6-284(-)
MRYPFVMQEQRKEHQDASALVVWADCTVTNSALSLCSQDTKGNIGTATPDNLEDISERGGKVPALMQALSSAPILHKMVGEHTRTSTMREGA